MAVDSHVSWSGAGRDAGVPSALLWEDRMEPRDLLIRDDVSAGELRGSVSPRANDGIGGRREADVASPVMTAGE